MYNEDAKWAPLAELIRLLPALADLIYQWPVQFPPCLLQAPHSKKNDHITLLHLHTFRLQMLGQHDLSAAQSIASDPHELALIRSPCLHTIWLEDHDGRLTPEQESDTGLIGRQLDALN